MATAKLSNGSAKEIPLLGFGTWKSAPGDAPKAVEIALKSGYRHIDCAALYGNEKEIGEIFKKVFSEGEIKREDVWITSKLWCHKWNDVEGALKQTLSDLQLDYLDLYLVHAQCAFKSGDVAWPAVDGVATLGDVPVHVMWKQMEAVAEKGLTKNVGISNFNFAMIQDLFCYAKVLPVVHQIEVHAYFTNENIIKFSKSKGMHITAYSPLANAKEGPLSDQVISDIAKSHNVAPAQVLIKWNIQLGHSVLPKSVTEERIKQNFDVFGFDLTEAELKQISGLNKDFRTCDLAEFWGSPYYD